MRYPRRLLALLLLSLPVAACGNPSDVGSTLPGPSANQIGELAGEVQDEILAQLPQMSYTVPGLPTGTVTPGGCPTGGPGTDADGDGLPTDLTLDFADPPCEVSGYRGGTLSVTGQVRVQDPDPAGATAFDLTLTDLAWDFTDTSATGSYRAVRNGSLVRQGDATKATAQATLMTVRSRPGIADARIDLAADWTFTAVAPGTLAAAGPLPSGTLAVGGTLHWRRSSEDWSLTLATPVPLAYTTACAAMAQPIGSGRVTLTGTIAGQAGILLLQWQGCGTEPARVWVPGP